MNITTEIFFEAISSIHQQIRETDIKYDQLVGISRGGLIPATVLSHMLEIPLRVVEWSKRDTGYQYCPEDLIDTIRSGKSILLVDDIVDSGSTMRELLDVWGMEDEINVDVACIVYNKAQDIVTPDFYYNVIDRNIDKDWINFWWEKNGHI